MENKTADVIDLMLNDAIKNNQLINIKSISVNLITAFNLEASKKNLIIKKQGKTTYRGFELIVDYGLDNNQVIINYK